MALGEELVRLGHSVFGLRRSAGSAAELSSCRISPLIGDISRPETLAPLPRDFDWVINCAATGGGTPADYEALYRRGAENLVAWLAGSPVRRFVYTSSTSVYGQNDGSLVTESSPVEPGSDSGRILAETEQIYVAAAKEKKLPAMVLRLAGIYGPGRGHWFKQFLRGTALIEGDGSRNLNMIHRDDVAGAIIAALERGRPGEIYNVVDDEPVSQLAFFEWLAAKLNRPLPPAGAVPGPDARRRGVTNKRISNQKLKAELGYRCKYPTFREGYGAEIEELTKAGKLG